MVECINVEKKWCQHNLHFLPAARTNINFTMARECSRLNLVCIDDSEFSLNSLNWYINNFHRDGDIVGLVHVQEMPTLSTLGLLGEGIAASKEFMQEVDKNMAKSRGLSNSFVVYLVKFLH